MIADSLLRQFLFSKKHLIRISVLEQELGITGKSIEHWIKGKRPLPSNWEEPLRNLLYPMVNEDSEEHNKLYQFDRVVVLENDQVFEQYKSLPNVLLDRTHFPLHLTNGAEVVYYKFISRNRKVSYGLFFLLTRIRGFNEMDI